MTELIYLGMQACIFLGALGLLTLPEDELHVLSYRLQPGLYNIAIYETAFHEFLLTRYPYSSPVSNSTISFSFDDYIKFYLYGFTFIFCLLISMLFLIFQVYDLISALGGQVGLWIGVSVLTVFEFVELLYDILKFGCSKLTKLGKRTVFAKDSLEMEPHRT